MSRNDRSHCITFERYGGGFQNISRVKLCVNIMDAFGGIWTKFEQFLEPSTSGSEIYQLRRCFTLQFRNRKMNSME